MKKLFLFVALAALTFTSCEKSDEVQSASLTIDQTEAAAVTNDPLQPALLFTETTAQDGSLRQLNDRNEPVPSNWHVDCYTGSRPRGTSSVGSGSFCASDGHGHIVKVQWFGDSWGGEDELYPIHPPCNDGSRYFNYPGTSPNGAHNIYQGCSTSQSSCSCN